MSLPPIPFVYAAGALRPVGRHAAAVLAEHLGEGQIVRMIEQEERSEVSHRHEFAWLREAWANLSDDLRVEYPSPEALRKRALIRTGWCTVQDYACGSKAEAMRWATFLRREVDEYTVIEVSESVVRVFRARSQARGKMNREEFTASKNAVLEWVSGLLGVEPGALEQARAA